MSGKKRLIIAITLCGGSLNSFAGEVQESGISKPSTQLKSTHPAQVLPKQADHVAIPLPNNSEHADKNSKGNNTQAKSSITVSQSSKKQTTEWGKWTDLNAFNSNDFVGKTKEKKANKYGSGIAGKDEKLLHELDKSSLLDYEPNLKILNFPPDGLPDVDFATEPGSPP